MLRARLKQLRTDLVLKVHGSGAQVVGSPTKEMADQPIQADWITEGSPRARAFCSLRADDGTIVAGEWDCTAGSFTWHYYEDEMVRLLEGEAFIEVDGEFRRFGPGDSLFFPLGQTARWRVPEYVRKVFFIRQPSKLVSMMRSFKLPGRSAA